MLRIRSTYNVTRLHISRKKIRPLHFLEFRIPILNVDLHVKKIMVNMDF